MQVGSLSRNTLKLLPSKSKTSKVIVGDESGVITCFSVKKGEVQEVFRQQPEEGERAVGCLVLGGKEGDKIFVANGQTIKAHDWELLHCCRPSTPESMCRHLIYAYGPFDADVIQGHH